MLTMLKIRHLTGTTEYDELLKQLANMVLFLQEKYQTGQYKSTYVYRGDYEYEKNKGWESKIYPGEALFALTQMYQAFGDARYKRSMDWALEFYSDKKQWKSFAFLSWTISAFVSLYGQTGESKYADYVFLLSDIDTQRCFSTMVLHTTDGHRIVRWVFTDKTVGQGASHLP